MIDKNRVTLEFLINSDNQTKKKQLVRAALIFSTRPSPSKPNNKQMRVRERPRCPSPKTLLTP